MHISVFSLLCRFQCSDLKRLDSDLRKSGHYSEVNKHNWWYPLIFAIPVITVGSVSNLMLGVLQVLFPGWTHSFTIVFSYKWTTMSTEYMHLWKDLG